MGFANATEDTAGKQPLSPPDATRPLGLFDVVRLTLAKNPDILIRRKQVEAGRGALLQASGQFDSTLGLSAGRSTDNSPLNQQLRDLYFPLSALTTRTASSGLMLSTPFRNGAVLSSSVSVTRTTGTSNDLNHLPAQSLGKVDFSINMPLLKGSGNSAHAGETAAGLERNAREQDLRFSISQDVMNTVAAYWNMLAAGKNLDITSESEASARLMLEQTRALVDADELPAADLNVLTANLLDRTAARISAEQSLLDARLALGQAVGLSYQQIATLELADGFPSFNTNLASLGKQLAHLIELGMKHRPDLAAARLRQESARILVNAAENSLKPQLNVTINVGYAGLAEGVGVNDITGGLVQNRTGLNKGAQIVFQRPFDNNAAHGLFLQQTAVYDQSTIGVSTLERSISTSIESAQSNLARSAMKLKESEETVNLYRITLDNENTKHKLGVATLIDVLSTNDRLINARLNNISYQLGYLNALARLSFETGTLLAEDKSEQSIQLNRLVSVPKFD